MNDLKFQEHFLKIDPVIYSALHNYVGAAYDRKARTYEKLVSSKIYNKIIWGTSPEDYKQFGRKAIHSTKGMLLDVGCGGLIQTSDIYARSKNSCVLVDNSSEMLKIAKERLIAKCGTFPENIKLLQADAFRLPFKDDLFDTVCSFGMIHLFDRKQHYINEVLRVLKPGGKFFLSTMTTKRSISRLYMQQLRKLNEFGELTSEEQILSLFNREDILVKTYMKGSMLFIEGQKNESFTTTAA